MKKKQQPITRGGKRSNAGRKPIADKANAVTIYIKQSRIQKLGGKDKVKKSLSTHINSL